MNNTVLLGGKKIRILYLPKSIKHLESGVFATVINFNEVPVIFLRRYNTEDKIEYVPTRSKTVLYYSEWKFLCQSLKNMYTKLFSYPSPPWDYHGNRHNIGSALDLTLSVVKIKAKPWLQIEKKRQNGQGQFASTFLLDLEQWKSLTTTHTCLTSDFIELSMLLRVKENCLPLLPLQSVSLPDYRLVNYTFKMVLKSHVGAVLSFASTRICLELSDLLEGLAKVDMDAVLHETMDKLKNISISEEHISLDGLVQEIISDFMYEDNAFD